jgi:hypothetical protein
MNRVLTVSCGCGFIYSTLMPDTVLPYMKAQPNHVIEEAERHVRQTAHTITIAGTISDPLGKQTKHLSKKGVPHDARPASKN